MPTIPPLRFSKRMRLIERGRKTGDPATASRFHAIAKLAAGLRPAEVARQLDLAASAVGGIARRYLAGGEDALYDGRVDNGARKVTADFLRGLAFILEWSPQHFGWERPTWTRELFGHEMARRGFPLVAACTMGRALRALGARLGSPKPVVLCPWPRERRLRVLATLRRLEKSASAEEPVYFSDEVDVHLNPKIGKDWMARGAQRRVVTPGKNAKHYLAGALCAATRRLVVVEASRKDSGLFCLLLWRLAAVHRRARRIHLIVDNFVIHSSRATRRVLESLGGRIVLHFLPPYCPDSNRIERVWLDLHANVTRNHRCPNLRVLLVHVRAFLVAYNSRGTLNPSLRRQIRAAA